MERSEQFQALLAGVNYDALRHARARLELMLPARSAPMQSEQDNAVIFCVPGA